MHEIQIITTSYKWNHLLQEMSLPIIVFIHIISAAIVSIHVIRSVIGRILIKIIMHCILQQFSYALRVDLFFSFLEYFMPGCGPDIPNQQREPYMCGSQNNTIRKFIWHSFSVSYLPPSILLFDIIRLYISILTYH